MDKRILVLGMLVLIIFSISISSSVSLDTIIEDSNRHYEPSALTDYYTKGDINFTLTNYYTKGDIDINNTLFKNNDSLLKTNSTNIINVFALSYNPADGNTVYFGYNPVVPSTTAGQSKIYIRASGFIIGVELYTYSATAGSNENWDCYIRKNGATDILIDRKALNTNERIWTNFTSGFKNRGAIASGDYIQIKCIQPSWGTNPLSTTFGGYIYVNKT